MSQDHRDVDPDEDDYPFNLGLLEFRANDFNAAAASFREAVQREVNDGCRVMLPETGHAWHVRLSDLDTGNVLFETTFKGGLINSTKRYYVRFRLEVWQHDKLVLEHEYSARDREILIQFPIGTLGDTMGWFPYAVKFQQRHGCRLTCAMAEMRLAYSK